MSTQTQNTQEIIDRIKSTEDFYKILNVDRNASEAEIKKEFRSLARTIHPDKCNLPFAEDAFKKINTAYKCLGSEESRRHYDMTGGEMNEGGMSGHPFADDMFANLFRTNQSASHPNIRTINFSDIFPEWFRVILRLPGVIPLIGLFCIFMFLKFFVWILSLSLYIFPVLYLTPARVRWWLVLLILVLSAFGII